MYLFMNQRNLCARKRRSQILQTTALWGGTMQCRARTGNAHVRSRSRSQVTPGHKGKWERLYCRSRTGNAHVRSKKLQRQAPWAAGQVGEVVQQIQNRQRTCAFEEAADRFPGPHGQMREVILDSIADWVVEFALLPELAVARLAEEVADGLAGSLREPGPSWGCQRGRLLPPPPHYLY